MELADEARACAMVVAGRAIAGVRKRRNESYLGCVVVPEPLNTIMKAFNKK